MMEPKMAKRVDVTAVVVSNGKPTKIAKTPNVGDLNDYVTLEADLAKARETIDKQRAHIQRLEKKMRGLLATTKDQIAWLCEYVAAREASLELRAQNERMAKSHNPNNPNTVGRHVTPFNVVDTTRRWTALAVQGANDYAMRLEKTLAVKEGA